MHVPEPALTPSPTVAPLPLPLTHYENFPVASWLCPPALRGPIAAIYHFAHTADDLADEGDALPAQRLQDLRDYRWALDATVQSALTPHPPHADNRASQVSTDSNPRWTEVFGPLQAAIQSHQLPVIALHDLLDAFEQDIEKTRDRAGYTDEAELLEYCRRSANPVGRLLLHLYGVKAPLALAQSDHICTALQLINFWQDLSLDIPRGRFYLPQTACSQYGVTPSDILARKQTENATKLIAYLAYSARALMQKGAPLVHQIPGRAGWELRLVVQGGLRILDRIEALNFATLNTRPTLRWWDVPVMLWRALWM